MKMMWQTTKTRRSLGRWRYKQKFDLYGQLGKRRVAPYRECELIWMKVKLVWKNYFLRLYWKVGIYTILVQHSVRTEQCREKRVALS